MIAFVPPFSVPFRVYHVYVAGAFRLATIDRARIRWYMTRLRKRQVPFSISITEIHQ